MCIRDRSYIGVSGAPGARWVSKLANLIVGRILSPLLKRTLVWRAVDKDGDGVITAAELRKTALEFFGGVFAPWRQAGAGGSAAAK